RFQHSRGRAAVAKRSRAHHRAQHDRASVAAGRAVATAVKSSSRDGAELAPRDPAAVDGAERRGPGSEAVGRHAAERDAAERRHTPGGSSRAATRVAVALSVAFVVSGSAGLIHEVVWTRLLGHLFGVSSFAISTVLAAYMGGLALGSWWIGQRI